MDQFWSNSIHFPIIYVWFELSHCFFIIEIVIWQTLWDNRFQYVYNAINGNEKFIKSQELFMNFWNWKPRCNLSSNLMNGLWFGTMMEFQPCYGFRFSFKMYWWKQNWKVLLYMKWSLWTMDFYMVETIKY